MPDTTRLRLDLKPRRCRYCRALFIPKRKQDDGAKFCSPNHRKAFWRYGGLPFDKMIDRLKGMVREIVRKEIAKRIDGTEHQGVS